MKYKISQGSPNLTNKGSFSVGWNSFVHACFRAYSSHHNLVIRPDDVWMAIITQFSVYVDKNAEKLRDRFVDFQGKKELEVCSAGSLMTADFGHLSMIMEEQIAKNIKDPSIREWIVPGFSTTSPVDRVVGAVVLMAAMKNYFSYGMRFECGLPSITLLGTVEDWKEIRHRAERLNEFDAGDKKMDTWTKMLFPVLDQFVSTASGNCDKLWWNKIAHKNSGFSGPTFLSGWITVFCVFSVNGNWQGGDGKDEWISVDFEKNSEGLFKCASDG